MRIALNPLKLLHHGSAALERRRAERHPSPELAAYFWNGDVPKAHDIRDISFTGLYLMTGERWLPGAMVLLTLQRKDIPESIPDQWIAVHAEVIRQGRDGVALSFVVSEHRDFLVRECDLENGANRKQLQWFLSNLFKDGKSHAADLSITTPVPNQDLN